MPVGNDDDGKDVSHTGDGFQAPHIWCEFNMLEHPLFESRDLLHGGVLKIDFLIEEAAGLRWEYLDGSIEPGSTFSN